MTPAPNTPESARAHTPEPWAPDGNGDWTVLGSDGKCAFDDGSAGGEYSPSCTIETRDRIVACVNACQGIASPEDAIAKARELIARLVKWDKDFPKGRIHPIGPNDGEKQLDAIVADAASILSALTPAAPAEASTPAAPKGGVS